VRLTFAEGVKQTGLLLDLTSSSLQHFSNDQQIQMVVKQLTVLSNDIEKNPGPFFEECYKVATDFCEEEHTDNDFYLRRRVDQLVSNQTQIHPIAFPEDFLTDDKVDIWRKCELKIKRNTAFDDNFRGALQSIWDFWCQALFQKELKHSKRKNQESLHLTTKSSKSPGDANLISLKPQLEKMSIPIMDKENKRCGFYQYGRTTDSSKFFCLDGKCKISKFKLKGVTKATLISHAKNFHLMEINFQKNSGKEITHGIRCDKCPTRTFSRNQTLSDHQKKFHSDLSLATDSIRTSNHNNLISGNNITTKSNNVPLQISITSTAFATQPFVHIQDTNSLNQPVDQYCVVQHQDTFSNNEAPTQHHNDHQQLDGGHDCSQLWESMADLYP